MKNELLEMLKAGSKEWNKWRLDAENVSIDLSYATLDEDLSGVDLSNMNFNKIDFSYGSLSGLNLQHTSFRYADLEGTNLSETNLQHASFGDARLGGANLYHADLRNASLSDCTFDLAYLDGADLSRADLRRAYFRAADLNKANLSEALMGETTFGNVDLRTVIGLNTIIHSGPSSVGVDTLYKSNGEIPELFLRGCGLPEVFITYHHSLVAKPIEFYSCFISYSHADKSFARRLHDALQGRGIRCWLDEHQVLPGDDIYDQVDQGIRLWDKVLLCCSKHLCQVGGSTTRSTRLSRKNRTS